MGSKKRIAKDILKVMLGDEKDTPFYDVFCGGGNLIQYADCKYKFASDIDKYCIAFLNKIKEDISWIPKTNQEFTKNDYKYVRDHKSEFPDYLVGHVGYNLSFGGRFFEGWRQDNKGTDYVAKSYLNAERQSKQITDISFTVSDYSAVQFLPSSIIYCDIPYFGTKKYKTSHLFNHSEFYDWTRAKMSEGHRVYISSYEMPSGFGCVWSKTIKSRLKIDDNSSDCHEKLFIPVER